MTDQSSFKDTWSSYESAVKALYEAPVGVQATAERSVGQMYTARLETNSEQVVTQAKAVRDVLHSSLSSSDLDIRELATLKLLAAAAYDLSIANDMLDLEKVKPERGYQAERSSRGALQSDEELNKVLDAPMDEGMSGLLEVERAAYPEDAESARLLLEKTITTYLNVIPKNSGELGQTAVSGVLTAGLGPAQGALSLAMQEILSRVPEGITLIARRAAEMVLESIAKLRTAVGEDQQKQVEDQAVKWLKDIQDQKDTVASLLNRLYETPRIAEETAGIIGSAPQDAAAAAYNQATEALEKLLDGSKKTRLTLGTVMRVMAFAKTPLMATPPWGTLAVYAFYVVILGYAVYSGGDYLDWYRTGETAWLDRVKGIRTVVRLSLAPPAEKPAGT